MVANRIRGAVERRRTQEALTREQNRRTALFEHVPEPTVAIEAVEGEPIVRAVNPAFENTFGFDAGTAVGQSLNDLIVPDGQRSDARKIDERAREGDLLDREVRRETTDGLREFLLRNIPVDGGLDYYGVYEDVTERKARERQLEEYNENLAEPANETIQSALTVPVGVRGIFQAVTTAGGGFDERDRNNAELLVMSMITAIDRIEQQTKLEAQNEQLEAFTDLVSHDLRNPLNIADAYLDLAREDGEMEHLEEVSRAHDRMDALVEDCWPPATEQEATVRIETERSIEADPGRLQELLENLVRNALEHGGEDVTVTVGDLDDGFYVADDGPGIPEEIQSQVFEDGYSTRSDGTGFGLGIVAQIAEAHGWEIGVTESDAGGARFEITGVSFAN